MVRKDATLMVDDYADRFPFSPSGPVHVVHVGEQVDLKSFPFRNFPPIAGHKRDETAFRRMIHPSAPASPRLWVATYAQTVMNL